MTSYLREITGKSKRNPEISYAKIARCRPLGLDVVYKMGGVLTGHYGIKMFDKLVVDISYKLN